MLSCTKCTTSRTSYHHILFRIPCVGTSRLLPLVRRTGTSYSENKNPRGVQNYKKSSFIFRLFGTFFVVAGWNQHLIIIVPHEYTSFLLAKPLNTLPLPPPSQPCPTVDFYRGSLPLCSWYIFPKQSWSSSLRTLAPSNQLPSAT